MAGGATERFQQPQRTRRHPSTKIGVGDPCIARGSDWAVPTPGCGPFPHQTFEAHRAVVTKRGVAWELRWTSKREPSRPKIAACVNGQNERAQPSCTRALPAAYRRRITACPKATASGAVIATQQMRDEP